MLKEKFGGPSIIYWSSSNSIKAISQMPWPTGLSTVTEMFSAILHPSLKFLMVFWLTKDFSSALLCKGTTFETTKSIRDLHDRLQYIQAGRSVLTSHALEFLYISSQEGQLICSIYCRGQSRAKALAE